MNSDKKTQVPEHFEIVKIENKSENGNTLVQAQEGAKDQLESRQTSHHFEVA